VSTTSLFSKIGPVCCVLLSLSACNGCNNAGAREDAGGAGTVTGASSSGGGSTASSSGSSGVSGAADAGSADAGPTPAGLEVLPTPAELDAAPGVGADLTLTVNLLLTDGTSRAARAPFFRSENPEIGSTSGAVFHAHGSRSGVARVRVRAEGLEVYKDITVRVRAVSVLPGAPADAPTAFGGAVGMEEARKPVLAYPLHDVVIPLNLAPMLIQWRSTLVNALFHVRISGANGSLDLYTAAGADRAEPDTAVWRALLNGHAGGEIYVDVEGVETGGGTRHLSDRVRVRLANADLTSVVYYWTLSAQSAANGAIVRISADGRSNQVLAINGNTSAGNFTCFGCHALSLDGQRMAVSYGGGDTPGGIIDPGNPAVNLVGPSNDVRWHFAAFSPDRSRLLTVRNKVLTLRDAETLAELTTLEDSTSHPTWSPTGNRIAYPRITSGGDDISFTASDLVIRDFDTTAGMPGAELYTVPGNGNALFYPGFTPGGTYVAFNRGAVSRSRSQDSSTFYSATLEWVETAAQSAPVVLARANPQQNSFNPSFATIVEGGYMWVAFFTNRPYGVVLQQNENSQIWVAAVDANPAAGQDPSHPGFWLPGQDVTTLNLSTFFAPQPCYGAGASCETDLGCCNGNLCRPNAQGALVCTPPDLACRLPGDECTVDADCCEGAGPCFLVGEDDLRCTPPELQCRQAGAACAFDDDCCDSAGTCFAQDGGSFCTPVEQQCVAADGTCEADEDCCEPFDCIRFSCSLGG